MARCITRDVVYASSAFALAAACLLSPTRAHAQFDTHDPQTGIEGSITLGYGGFSNGAAFRAPGSGTSGAALGSFGMQFLVGYRFMPVLSAGVHFGYNVLGVRNGGAGDGASAAALGVYLRVHVLSFMQRRSRSYAGTPDLFLGAGFDPFAQVAAWNGSNGVTTSGFAFPFQIGFNYAVTENIEVGVLGMIAPWTDSSECVHGGSGFVLCGSGGNHEAEAYLFIGLGISGHFNLLR